MAQLPPALRSIAETAAASQNLLHGANSNRITLFGLKRDHTTCFRRKLKSSFVTIYFSDSLVFFNIITVFDQPLGDFYFGDRLSRRGNFHF